MGRIGTEFAYAINYLGIIACMVNFGFECWFRQNRNDYYSIKDHKNLFDPFYLIYMHVISNESCKISFYIDKDSIIDIKWYISG